MVARIFRWVQAEKFICSKREGLENKLERRCRTVAGSSESKVVKVRITDVEASDESLVQAIAAMLVDGFRQNAPEAFPDLATAIAEVRESLAPDRVSRVAVDDQGRAVGWIGGIKHYSGHTWELHPLVVKLDQQRRGIGRALVRDLELRVVALGGSTIYLGTDDE